MEKNTKKTNEKKESADAGCNDRTCHIHGHLKAHGRTFEGNVTKKFPRRIVIEFERMTYVRKYERYARAKTKIHARLPDCMKSNINVGDYIRVQECRPLSKIIHFVVINKIKGKEEVK